MLLEEAELSMQVAAVERGDAGGCGGVRRDSRAWRHGGFCFFSFLASGEQGGGLRRGCGATCRRQK
jgi:hypothetical protein